MKNLYSQLNIVFIFMGNKEFANYLLKSRLIAIGYPLISLLGLIVSYIYDSNLWKVWLFILVLFLPGLFRIVSSLRNSE